MEHKTADVSTLSIKQLKALIVFFKQKTAYEIST